jgi:hypothetical protein
VERWDAGPAATWGYDDQTPDQGRRFIAPVAVRGQPLPLRRARDAVFEHATAPGRRPPAESRFQAGDRVEHARFGRGVIRASEMTGAGEEVVIDFESAGHRRFAVTDAVLRRVEG